MTSTGAVVQLLATKKALTLYAPARSLTPHWCHKGPRRDRTKNLVSLTRHMICQLQVTAAKMGQAHLWRTLAAAAAAANFTTKARAYAMGIISCKFSCSYAHSCSAVPEDAAALTSLSHTTSAVKEGVKHTMASAYLQRNLPSSLSGQTSAPSGRKVWGRKSSKSQSHPDCAYAHVINDLHDIVVRRVVPEARHPVLQVQWQAGAHAQVQQPCGER